MGHGLGAVSAARRRLRRSQASGVLGPRLAETTIDAAGHNVQISGGGAVRLFEAATNLVLRGLKLMNGANSNAGAALYIHPGAAVIVDRCVFGGNLVTAPNGISGTSGTTN